MQLEGDIRFGATPDTLEDFSDEVSSLVLNTQIQTVARPKTFAKAREEQRKSGIVDAVSINLFNDEQAGTLWALVWDAQRDDETGIDDGRQPGELYFSATYTPTGETFTGWVLPSDLDTGGTVGEWKQQSKTWPARDVSKDEEIS